MTDLERGFIAGVFTIVLVLVIGFGLCVDWKYRRNK